MSREARIHVCASTARERPHDFDVIVGRKGFLRPLRATHDRPVDRDRKKLGRRIDPTSGQKLADCGCGHVLLYAVDLEPHQPASASTMGSLTGAVGMARPANRSGVNGATAAGKRPVNT